MFLYCTVIVFNPGDKMEEGEELTYDSSGYELYHAVSILDVCFECFCTVGLLYLIQTQAFH